MEKKIKQIIFISLLMFSLSAQASSVIRNIIFEGNDVTKQSLLLREMYVSEGASADLKKIEDSVQAIMDLGLFKSVRYYLVEDDSNPDEVLVDLVIFLEEKIYLLVVPRVRVNEDETHLGVQLRWDNMFGLNHEMRFLMEDRGTTDGVDEFRQRIKYNYPNVKGSKYALNFKLLNRNDVDEIDGLNSINRKDQSFGIGLFKWLNPTGRNRGWFTGIGFDYRQRENEVVLGNAISNETDAMVIDFQYGFKDIHQYAYNRGGKTFGYALNASHHSLGSESEFFHHRLFYRSYYRFDSRPKDNLNVQTLIGYSTNDILDDKAFSLGSSQALRGFESGSFSGNTKLLLNIEYMMPSPVSPALRFVYFIDIGNTYEEFSDIRHENLEVGAGMGLRWKIPVFVKLDLRLDIGFGVGEDDYVASFGTRHVF